MYAIVFHAHQKIDKAAYRLMIKQLSKDYYFPNISEVLKFEAGKGPDNVKLKRDSKTDQPWHFLNPLDKRDNLIDNEIKKHYNRLVIELKKQDEVRASFEASWLAHAIVDGLTPAHHYPYEKELEEIRGGLDRETREGLLGRVYVKSDSLVESVHKSLKLIGPKGLLTSHAMFEAGAYAIIAPMHLGVKKEDAKLLLPINISDFLKEFRSSAKDIFTLNIYGRFCESGWIKPVIRDIKSSMAPTMVRLVAEAWYSASIEAGK